MDVPKSQVECCFWLIWLCGKAYWSPIFCLVISTIFRLDKLVAQIENSLGSKDSSSKNDGQLKSLQLRDQCCIMSLLIRWSTTGWECEIWGWSLRRRRERGNTVAVHSCLMGGYREEEITILESLSERKNGNSHKLQHEHQLDARKLFSQWVWLKLNLFDSTVDSPKCDWIKLWVIQSTENLLGCKRPSKSSVQLSDLKGLWAGGPLQPELFYDSVKLYVTFSYK